MHTIDVLEEALDSARRLGYEIRQEWLDGARGGACEVRGRRLIFIDLAQPASEQLEEVLEILRQDARAGSLTLSSALRRLCQASRAA